jgi:hypothetical protein
MGMIVGLAKTISPILGVRTAADQKLAAALILGLRKTAGWRDAARAWRDRMSLSPGQVSSNPSTR